MKRATAPAGTKWRSFGWRSVAWILLVAFTLQSFVTETHIHGVAAGEAVAAAKSLANGSAHKTPADDSAATCPFCQAIVHSGAFFTPSAPVLITPVLWAVRVVPILFVGTTGFSPAHGWQSRAPPQH